MSRTGRGFEKETFMSTSMRYAIMTMALAAALGALIDGLAPSKVKAEAQGPMITKQAPRTISITLGNQTINAVVADTDASRREGLLGWNQITEETGMLLDFAIQGEYAIHMQGMKFPIDAVWIDANGLIKLIYNDIAPNSGLIYPSIFPCKYCLEIKAGFCRRYGIKIGESVQFGAAKH
jgi:uncharacterized protein